MATSQKIAQPAWLPTKNATTGAQLTGMVPYTDQDMRRFWQDALGSKSGIINSGDLAVTASGTADMNVHVAPGRYRIAGNQSSVDGLYMGGNNSSVALSGFAADGVKDRKDAVAVQIVYDNTNSQWYAQLVVLQGDLPSTGAPKGPGEPGGVALPANTLVRSYIYMTSGATNIPQTAITDATHPIGRDFLDNCHAEAYLSVNQGLSTTTPIIVNYNTILSDPNGSIATGSGWSYTAPVPGRYFVSAAVAFTTSQGDGQLQVLVAGAIRLISTTIWGTGNVGNSPGDTSANVANGIVRANAGDKIQVQVQVMPFGGPQIQGGQGTTYFQVHYLGGL